MIPKILHYTWLGDQEQPDNVKRSFVSWKRFLPDFDFMFWNEQTYDITSAPRFVKDAYQHKKYAFASDYIRLWALNKYGGVYLDSDTEVLQPLDIFLNDEMFIGMQVFDVPVSRSRNVTKTALSIGVIGSVANHPYIEECMESLADSTIVNSDGTLNLTPTNYRMQEILSRYGLQIEDCRQHLSDGIVVYPSSVFTDRLNPNMKQSSNHCAARFPRADIKQSNNLAYTYHWGEMTWFTPLSRGPLYKLCWNLNLMGLYKYIEKCRHK